MSLKKLYLICLFSFGFVFPSVANPNPRVHFGTNQQYNNGFVESNSNSPAYPMVFYRNLSKKMSAFSEEFANYNPILIGESRRNVGHYQLLELTMTDNDIFPLAKGIYIFDQKQKPVGFCLIEQKLNLGDPNYSFSAASQIKNLPQNKEYLKGRLNIPNNVQIAFYENRENNMIERYAIISMFDPLVNDYHEILAMDAYYPIDLEKELEIDAIAYLNKSLAFNPFNPLETP